MTYLSGSAIYDTRIIRDDNGTAITGLTSGSFATLEAYTLPSAATTATPTVTEIGAGEYAFAFTPSTSGTWSLHIVYNSGGVFREYSSTYNVLAAAVLGASAAGALYATVATVKQRLDRNDTKDDDAIDDAIEAASRMIDGLTSRAFYQAVDEARYFTAEDSGYLEVDDLVSVTTLETDSDGDRTYEDSWASTDYDLEPYNGAAKGLPYTSIAITPAGRYGFPVGTARGVKITGTWGWPSVPHAIRDATIIQAIRLLKRKDAPFGVSGSPDLGLMQSIPKVDPDVAAMVAPYRRLTVGAV